MAGNTLSRIVNGKVMHRRRHPVEYRFVSPFYPVSGGYRFYFNTDLDTPHVRIDYYDEGQLQLNTAISGRSRPLTSQSIIAALVRQPLLTIGVMARIHWQALRLWLKGVSLHPNPSSSSEEISR